MSTDKVAAVTITTALYEPIAWKAVCTAIGGKLDILALFLRVFPPHFRGHFPCRSEGGFLEGK